MRIAAFDIGTNTALCLIVEAKRESENSYSLRVLHDGHSIPRLGEGVDSTGYISKKGLLRLTEAIHEQKTSIAEFGVDSVAAVGTSAMRDAANRDEIITNVREETGIQIELLSGSDEAQWTYRGALLGIALKGEVAVVDIGGGSTEISVGDGVAFREVVSVNVGAVRMTERFFKTSPITKEAAFEAKKTVRQLLRENVSPLHADTLVAVAGTPTTLAAMHQGLKAFDKVKVQAYRLSREAIEQLQNIMFDVTTPVLLDHFPAINQARADILPAGTLVLTEVMDFLSATAIVVSTRGLRFGIAMREIERRLGHPAWFTMDE